MCKIINFQDYNYLIKKKNENENIKKGFLLNRRRIHGKTWERFLTKNILNLIY